MRRSGVEAGEWQAQVAVIQLRDLLRASSSQHKWKRAICLPRITILSSTQERRLSQRPKEHLSPEDQNRMSKPKLSVGTYLWQLQPNHTCGLPFIADVLSVFDYRNISKADARSVSVPKLRVCKAVKGWEENINLLGSHWRKRGRGSLCFLRREGPHCALPPLVSVSDYKKGWGQITAITISISVGFVNQSRETAHVTERWCVLASLLAERVLQLLTCTQRDKEGSSMCLAVAQYLGSF